MTLNMADREELEQRISELEEVRDQAQERIVALEEELNESRDDAHRAQESIQHLTLRSAKYHRSFSDAVDVLADALLDFSPRG